MLSALTLVLAATPLDVRVLERLQPTHARLTAKAITCDGKPVSSPAELDYATHEVKVGALMCAELKADGGVAVTVGETTRRYAGSISVRIAASTLRFVNHVELEDYLPAVVAAEAGAVPPAALEAQAVVSRTFAAASRQRHHQDGYDVCDLTHCQVYRGHGDETKAAANAVEKTKGQVLLLGGMMLKPAFFHSSCGGATSRAADVFHDDGVGVGVRDELNGGPACRAAPDFAWEWKVDRTELARALGVKSDGAAFEPLRRDASGRVLELRSFGKRLSGPQFQSAVGRVFGWTSLRSMKVSAETVENVVRFTGTGFGHGVGLCQYGARARAEAGESAEIILKRYFPDAKLGPMSQLKAK